MQGSENTSRTWFTAGYQNSKFRKIMGKLKMIKWLRYLSEKNLRKVNSAISSMFPDFYLRLYIQIAVLPWIISNFIKIALRVFSEWVKMVTSKSTMNFGNLKTNQYSGVNNNAVECDNESDNFIKRRAQILEEKLTYRIYGNIADITPSSTCSIVGMYPHHIAFNHNSRHKRGHWMITNAN